MSPSAGIIISSSAALLTSISILTTNEYISKLKIAYFKLGYWINVNTLLFRKTLKQSMMDGKRDEKEAQVSKKIHNHYLDKGKEIMKKAQIRVEDIFGKVIGEQFSSPEQLTKPNHFLAKKIWIQLK